jgi:Holliday junction DNA helicase RuvB
MNKPQSFKPKIVSSVGNEDDLRLDQTLRPQSFDEFVGQSKIVNNVKIYITAAQKRGEALDHILFTGLPGLGKTTLAHLVAKRCQAEIKVTSGPAMERPADLVGILTNLQPKDILFIDEIHRLPKTVEEYLYSAMEDYTVNIMIDQGPHARSVNIDVPKFTLIGATTREGLLSDPFRARFGILEKLELYPTDDLLKITVRSAKLLNVKLEDDAGQLISQRARGTPRVANRLLKRIRDLAQVKSNNVINLKIALEGLEMLGIDNAGLEETDRKILRTIINHGGGPIGLKTIAVSVGEEEDTIEEVYEPFLIQCCFLEKTPRGRKVTKSACEHLKEKIPINLIQKDIF